MKLIEVQDSTDITSEVFLDNLKNATPWVVKVAGVELLSRLSSALDLSIY